MCDGTNGTPNLKDRFIVGWDGASPRSGGNATINIAHSHTINDHVHLLNATDTNHEHSVNGHTLTINEMPSHNHGLYRPPYRSNEAIGSNTYWRPGSNTFDTFINDPDDIQYTGGGQAHDHGLTAPMNRNWIHGHGISGATDRGTDSRLSGTQDIRPPYYALAFIMKL